MLKNKIIGRKIRNIVILLMALIIMIGAYRYIDRSLAEKVIDLDAIALDNYGYLANERFVLQAKQIEEDLYEVELPESINTKKINQIVKVTLEEIVPEVTTESGVKENSTTAIENITEDSATTEPQTENATVENTIQENPVVEENTTPEEIVTETPIEENITREETVTETPVEENTTPDETITENVTEEPVILEIVENRIYLTREQIENKQINIEVEYDIAILEKNEEGNYDKTLLIEKTEEERKTLEDAGVIGTVETEESTQERETLYNKVLKYEDEKNGKLVELKGFLPIDAELQVEELSKSQVKELFGDTEIDVAYDIKIIVKVIKQVPIDETNPESEMKEIIETIEINPEEYDEKCEVTIKDKKIEEDAQVIHVKEDNTLEKMTVKESSDGNVSFEAQTFSVYGVAAASEDGIATVADLPSNSYSTPYLPTGYSQVSGTDLSSGLVIEDSSGNQFVWVEVPRSIYSSTTLNYNLNTLTGSSLTNAYNKIESEMQSYASAYRASGFEDTYSSDLSTVMTSGQYTELKQKMIKSVFMNGGFWVGRYETGLTSKRTQYSSTTPAKSATVIKQHAYPCNYTDIKQAQTISARFAPTGYQSSLMFGIQWDLIMKYLEVKVQDLDIADLKTDSTSWGNNKRTVVAIGSGAQYSPQTDPEDAATIGIQWYPTPFSKTADDRILLTTGAHSSFMKQNISDISGNLHEYTLEMSEETGLNVARGSYHGSGYNSSTGRMGSFSL